jgi:ADP-heptose:LPS heptosyltransferase
MRTSVQVFIDKKFGSLLNMLLYVPVRILGKLLRINHSLERPFKKIIVTKYKGMGSIIQASALLKTLRNQYPDAEILFVSTTSNAGILNYYHEVINRSILINDSGIWQLFSSSLRCIFKLLKFRADLFIDLEIYSNYSTLMCTLSAAKNRMGFYKSDKDYRTGLYTHLMVYNIKAPLSEIYLQTARMLNIKSPERGLIYLNELPEAGQSLKDKLPGLGQKYFVINPNASDLRLERRWPASSYLQLCSQLPQIYPQYKFVLIGNKQEKEYVSQISKMLRENTEIIDSSGLLNLEELVELLRGADIIITNDTGPLHLSLALQKNTVGLFGPCSPAQYGQMEFCTSVYMNLYCSPCVHEFVLPPCGGNNRCMQDISVEQVFQAINKASEPEKTNKLNNIKYTSNNRALGFVENRNK